jgi:ABC-2 type transport system permease protein
VTSVGLFGFVEVWIVSKLLYRADFTVHHPWQFTATLVASAATMAATALALSALFVLMRNAITFVNSSSYPFFVLGGVLVPVSFLPGWIQPVSSAVFLSWSADLMRATLAPGPVDGFGYRIAALVGLGAVGLALGSALMVRVVRKVRASGELGFQ